MGVVNPSLAAPAGGNDTGGPMPELESPQNPLFPDDQQPSTRSIRLRLVVLVLLVVGIASLLSSPFFKHGSSTDSAVADAIQEQMNVLSEKDQGFRRKADAFAAARGMDVASLSSKEILDKRLELSAAALIANEELIATGDAAGGSLQRKLSAQGVPADASAKAVSEFESIYWSPRKKLAIAAGGTYRAGNEMLRILRDRWGHWTYDKAALEPKFDTPEGDVEFQKIQSEVHRAIDTFRNTK